jgi:hypothetical protein
MRSLKAKLVMILVGVVCLGAVGVCLGGAFLKTGPVHAATTGGGCSPDDGYLVVCLSILNGGLHPYGTVTHGHCASGSTNNRV